MTQNKKRILYVITKSNFGGAQRNVFELATHLPKEEFDVAVAFGGAGLLKTKLQEAEIATYTIPSFVRDISLLKELKAMGELFRIIREFHPDVVHLHSSKAGGTGALTARLCGIKKIVFTAHGWPFFEDRNFVWRTLVWIFSYLTALLVHEVIVVSQNDLKNHHMPFTGRKFTFIPNAVPEIVFKSREEARQLLFSEEKLARHASDFFAVTTSEHTQNKNLPMLIRALSTYNSVASQKIFLTIMHTGEDTQKLESLVKKNKLANFVSFTGYLDEARSYLKAFDLFILPSLKEGLPYGLLEAGKAGLPCIASNVGGIPEIVTHEKTGILIDPHHEQSLIEALHTFASAREKRALYGKKLQEYIDAEYTLQSLIEKTRMLYLR